MSKSSLGGTGFEGMRGSWEAAEVWHQERPGEATGECGASTGAEAPEMKRV